MKRIFKLALATFLMIIVMIGLATSGNTSQADTSGCNHKNKQPVGDMYDYRNYKEIKALNNVDGTTSATLYVNSKDVYYPDLPYITYPEYECVESKLVYYIAYYECPDCGAVIDSGLEPVAIFYRAPEFKTVYKDNDGGALYRKLFCRY